MATAFLVVMTSTAAAGLVQAGVAPLDVFPMLPSASPLPRLVVTLPATPERTGTAARPQPPAGATTPRTLTPEPKGLLRRVVEAITPGRSVFGGNSTAVLASGALTPGIGASTATGTAPTTDPGQSTSTFPERDRPTGGPVRGRSVLQGHAEQPVTPQGDSTGATLGLGQSDPQRPAPAPAPVATSPGVVHSSPPPPLTQPVPMPCPVEGPSQLPSMPPAELPDVGAPATEASATGKPTSSAPRPEGSATDTVGMVVGVADTLCAGSPVPPDPEPSPSATATAGPTPEQTTAPPTPGTAEPTPSQTPTVGASDEPVTGPTPDPTDGPDETPQPSASAPPSATPQLTSAPAPPTPGPSTPAPATPEPATPAPDPSSPAPVRPAPGAPSTEPALAPEQNGTTPPTGGD